MQLENIKKYILNNISFAVSIALFFLQLLLSCSGNRENKITDQQIRATPASTLKKPPATFSDTLIITAQSAVFYSPDSIQLEKIKLSNKKNVFESMTHEYFYQMRNARVTIKKLRPQLRIIETFKARYLLFIKGDKSYTYIDLNNINDISGLFLFDTKKDPARIDMMNIDTELETYFKD